MCRQKNFDTELMSHNTKSPFKPKLRRLKTEIDHRSLTPPKVYIKSDPLIQKLPQIPKNLTPIIFSTKHENFSPNAYYASFFPPNWSPNTIDHPKTPKTNTKHTNHKFNFFKFQVDTAPQKSRTRSLTPLAQKSFTKSTDDELEFLINEYADDKKTTLALNNIIKNWKPKFSKHRRIETAVKTNRKHIKRQIEELMEQKKKSIERISEYIDGVIQNIKLEC
ncbi:unnamed protein product [Blepharisma stoltei]|uniref:Uncharacterized protein n=1 Tax=Blepharisma stoltei TaxID=1481888 RepID=A0AAU9J5A8_9CILI|nr:unnamed protein product [Blepharisma stoltei]